MPRMLAMLRDVPGQQTLHLGCGDAAGRPEVFTVDRYFERAAWPEHITQKFRAPVIRRDRTLEDYMAGAIGAGFVLLELHEAEPTQEELSMSSRFAKIARIPYFL